MRRRCHVPLSEAMTRKRRHGENARCGEDDHGGGGRRDGSVRKRGTTRKRRRRTKDEGSGFAGTGEAARRSEDTRGAAVVHHYAMEVAAGSFLNLVKVVPHAAHGERKEGDDRPCGTYQDMCRVIQWLKI